MATLNQETLDLANAVRLALVTLRTLVNGNATDLAALETTNQSNLVAAINEVKAAAVDLSAYATTDALTSGLAGKAATAHKSTHATGGSDPLTLADLGADARYPSINYAGANPNYPQTITITGVATDGINGTLIYCGIVNGKPAWGTDGVLITGTGNPYYTLVSWGTDGDVWRVARQSIYSAVNLFAAATPAGLTGWTVATGSGQPVITASATPTGTVIGQLCRSSTALWRWDGSVWVEVTATASSIPRTAVLAALPSSAPLPIENGGTGVGSTGNLGTFRTDMGLGTGNSPTFAGQTLTAPLQISGSATIGGVAGTLFNFSADGGGRIFATGSNTPYVHVRQSTNKFVRIGPTSIGYGTTGTVPTMNLTMDSGVFAFDAAIESTTAAGGLILKSPSGTRYRVTVANGGALTTTEL
jgi:hypothetical protein